MDAQRPSLPPEKILMAPHGAGRSDGSTRATFTRIGLRHAADATAHDGHRALCPSIAKALS